MARQIRRLGVVLLVLYGAVFVQLNLTQLVRADGYDDNPANTRAVQRDYNEPRGQIVSREGVVLARSVAVDDPTGQFERQREYPTGDLFGQITGYFSFTAGSDGVEKTYNDDLAGRTQRDTPEGLKDALLGETQTGDVVLTLSAELQQLAKDQLAGRRGTVVAIDTRDGSILAMYSNPSYDPGPLSQVDQRAADTARQALLDDPAKPLLARSYRETYFPGSTFKVVTGSAGLTSGAVTPDDPSYPSSGSYTPPQTTSAISNFGRSVCGGTLFEILVVSCNTAFAQMGVDIGGEALSATAEAFGFNDVPPLDLPNGASSPIASAATLEADPPVRAQTSIGQNSVRATPLQMALVAAGVANDGTIMTPHVMAEVRDDEGTTVRTYEPTQWRQAVSSEVAATMTEAMVQVVERGTATRLQVPGVATAGKTGTAERGDGTSEAWVVGFAPADNPRVAVAVIIEGEPGASEATGGRVAAPVGGAMLEAALRVVP